MWETCTNRRDVQADSTTMYRNLIVADYDDCDLRAVLIILIGRKCAQSGSLLAVVSCLVYSKFGRQFKK